MKTLLLLLLICSCPLLLNAQSDTTTVDTKVPKLGAQGIPIPPPPAQNDIEDDYNMRVGKQYLTEAAISSLFLNDRKTFFENNSYDENVVSELFNYVQQTALPIIDFSKGRRAGFDYNGVEEDPETGRETLTDLSYYRKYFNKDGNLIFKFSFYYEVNDVEVKLKMLRIDTRNKEYKEFEF